MAILSGKWIGLPQLYRKTGSVSLEAHPIEIIRIASNWDGGNLDYLDLRALSDRRRDSSYLRYRIRMRYRTAIYPN